MSEYNIFAGEETAQFRAKCQPDPRYEADVTEGPVRSDMSIHDIVDFESAHPVELMVESYEGCNPDDIIRHD